MKKVLSVLLALVMVFSVCTLFSACSKSDKNELVMATNAEFPPYEYKEGDKIVGIDVEIAEAIAKKLGKTLTIEDVDFDAIITGVQSGKYDIGVAGMTVTEDRLKSVNFSDTYATGVQVVIVTEDSAIKTVDDLKGDGSMKIGVQQGTTGDIYASADVKDGGYGSDNVKRFQSGAEAVLALKTGKVDAVIIDNEPAKNYVAANEGLKILDTEFTNEDYAICVAKGNDELLADINKALAELKADGTLQQIIEKYIPSNGNSAEPNSVDGASVVDESNTAA